MRKIFVSAFIGVIALAVVANRSAAWDYTGHRIVNQLALASLPSDFPDFVREPAAAERIAFLAGEADRWRNVPDLIMRQSGGNWTDHFLDVEQLAEAGIDAKHVTSFRYDFAVQFAAGRAAHAEKFAPIDPTKNRDHTREWPGFVPWTIAEYFGRIRSAFSYLKVFEELGTPEEIANAKANVIYLMGVSGHFVGDCAQPLHTTVHHNGWVGPNPNGYSTASGVHAWIDGGFIAETGIKLTQLTPKIVPAHVISLAPREDSREPLFVAAMEFLLEQNARVEPLYQLEKAGKFKVENGNDVSEGKAFIEHQLLAGGEMLGSIWLTAWRSAVPDTYLRTTLLKRQASAAKLK